MPEHASEPFVPGLAPEKAGDGDVTAVDLYGPRSGSKPALKPDEVTDLLKSRPGLAKSLKLEI